MRFCSLLYDNPPLTFPIIVCSYQRKIEENKWELCRDRLDGMTSRRVLHIATRRIKGELKQHKKSGGKLSPVPTRLMHTVKPGAAYP